MTTESEKSASLNARSAVTQPNTKAQSKNISVQFTKPENFPFTGYFHDLETEEVKKMKVPEHVWDEALKTFEDKDIDNRVMFKHMAKHEDTEIL